MSRRGGARVVIIGGGLNGLVAAAFLGRAGFQPIVLEEHERPGGALATSEIAPGFRVPALAHRADLDRRIARALGLDRFGLQVLEPAARVMAPSADGRVLTLWNDVAQARQSIGSFSTRDAERYVDFLRSFAAIGAVLRGLLSAPPPSLDHPTAGDVLELLRAGRRFRRLPADDAYRLLRWLPMSVADLVREWFDSEPLASAIAAGGVFGGFAGPRSAGTGAVLLLRGAGSAHPVAAGWTARGGIGRVADALVDAANAAGADVRTLARVARIKVSDGVATGVVLTSGEEIDAAHVVSSADPRRTFLDLVEPVHLAPEFAWRIRHIRMRGALAKVNYAVDSLPAFAGVASPEALSGCVRLASSLDAIERAFDAVKYGGVAEEPWIELAIPSVLDGSLAPPGRHVVSAYVQFVPHTPRAGSWADTRDSVGAVVTRVISRYAPGFERSVLAQQVIGPADLEREHGLTGGHIFHGELALDQLAVARPLLGWARYATPIRRLWLCGTGTHPGTGADGRSGMLAANEIARVGYD
jgi:phytoene dehydrogenase-like protein